MPATNSTLYKQGHESWWGPRARLGALNRLNPARFSYFDKHLPEWKGKRVLDVGCGGGFTSEFLIKRGAVVSGIDLSEEAVEAAELHAIISELAVDYHTAPAEKIPYPNDTFDSVVCVDVLEHLTDVEKAVTEMHRVLKKDGYLFFDTINKTFMSRVIMIWLLENIVGLIPQGAHDWDMFIEPERLTKILTKSNFKNVELRGLSFRGVDENNDFAFVLSKNMPTMYIGSAQK